eukprot:395683-Pyramimonas_sp.AAC.2
MNPKLESKNKREFKLVAETTDTRESSTHVFVLARDGLSTEKGTIKKEINKHLWLPCRIERYQQEERRPAF